MRNEKIRETIIKYGENQKIKIPENHEECVQVQYYTYLRLRNLCEVKVRERFFFYRDICECKYAELTYTII